MDSSVGDDDVNNPARHEGVDDDLKYMLIQLCEEVNFLRMIRKESEERMRHLVTGQHKHERQLEEEILKNSLLKEKHEQKLIDLDASYQDKIRQLTREKNKLIWENESWEKDLKSVKDEVRSLQLEKYNLERMIREQSHLLKTQTAAGEGYMKQATLFEERFTSMKHSVESCNSQVMNLSKEVNEAKILNERLTFINAHHACLKRDLEGKVEYKGRLISELEVKIKLQDATIDMEPPESEERSELLSLEKVKQMKANEDVIRKQLDNAQQRIGELSKQLEEAQLLLDQYLTIHHKYKDNISIMEDEKKDMQDKITKLEEERSKEELKGKQIEKEMDRLTAEWNEKEKSFEVKLSNLNSKVESLNEANNTLEMQNNLLETKRKELLIKVKNQQEQGYIPKVDVGTMANIHSVSNPRSTNSAVETCDVTESSIIQPHRSTTGNDNNNIKTHQSEVFLGDVDGVTSFQTDRKDSHYNQLQLLDSSTTDGSLVIMTSESSKLDHSGKELDEHHPSIHPATEGADISQTASDATVQEGVYKTDVRKVMSGFKHPEIMESKGNDSECKIISTGSLLSEQSSQEEIPNVHVDNSHVYNVNSIVRDGDDRATDLHELPDQVDRQLKNSAPQTGKMNLLLNSGKGEGKSSCSKPKDGDVDPHQIALPSSVFHTIDENVCAVDEELITVSGANDSTPREETYAVIGNVDAVATENEMRFTSSKHEIGGSLEIATQTSIGKDPCVRLHPENESSKETRTEVELHNTDDVFSQFKNNSQSNLLNIDDEQDGQNENPIRMLAHTKQKDTTLPKRVVDVEEFVDIAKISENLPVISERDYTVSDIGDRIAETASSVLNTLLGVDSTLSGAEDHSSGGPILDITLNAPDVDENTILHRTTSTRNINEKNFTHPCKDGVAPNSNLSSGNEIDTFRSGVATKKSQDEDDEGKQLTSEHVSQFLRSSATTDVMPTADQSVNPSVSLSNFIKRKGAAEWPIVGHEACPYPRYSSQEAEQSKPQVTGGTFTPPSVLTSSGIWLAGDQQSCPPVIDVRRSNVNAGRSTNTISNFMAPTGKLHSPLTLIGVTATTNVQTDPTTSYSSSSDVSSFAVLPDSLKNPPNRLKRSSEICPDQVRIPVTHSTIETNPDPILTSVEVPLPRTSIAEVEPLKVNFERNIKIVLKDVNSVSKFVSELSPRHEKSASDNLASNSESLTMSRTEVPSNTRQAEDKNLPSSGTVQKRPYQFEDPSEVKLFSDEEDDISSSLSKEIERARNILSRSRLKRPRSCKPTLPISGEFQEE